MKEYHSYIVDKTKLMGISHIVVVSSGETVVSDDVESSDSVV